MQTFFTTIYAALISLFQSQKPADFGLYKTVVFSLVGWQTLGLTLLLALVFYFVLYGPRVLGPYNRRGFWFILLMVAAGLGAVVAAYTSVKQGAVSTEAISRSYRTYFSMANALVAAIAFLLWSVLFSRFKGNAQHSPFGR